MYFGNIPYVKYDTKPTKYPFSESDYVIAKNFFRRYKINPDAFSYTVVFKKYILKDGERLDTVAKKAYGNQFYDWIIVLTNNMINPLFDMPLSENSLKKFCESQYEDPYSSIKHYKTISNEAQISAFNRVIIKGDQIVDETFYNSSHKKFNQSTNSVESFLGEVLSTPITFFDYEVEQNEKKREIYLLKPKYLNTFIEDFRKTNLYSSSTDTINSKVKKTGV